MDGANVTAGSIESGEWSMVAITESAEELQPGSRLDRLDKRFV